MAARVQNEEQVGPPKREYDEDSSNDSGALPHRAKVRAGSLAFDLYVGISGYNVGVEMTRYKSRTSAKAIERDYPHFVEFPIPEGGFGDRLNAMHDWHLARSVQARHGQSRRDAKGQYFIRWCFADATMAKMFADAFEKEFGNWES